MDLDTLYNLSKTVAQNAERMATQNVSGYFAYLAEYNRLVSYVHEIFGEEATKLFQKVDLTNKTAEYVGGRAWPGMAEFAVSRLSLLTAYLQSKLIAPNRQVHAVLDLVKGMLRPSIFETPKRERDVQNTLEIIFRARDIDFRREAVFIDYSSKRYIPDFTFESMNLALEVKFVNDEKKEKIIIDEINADIVAYQTRYRWIIVVVYDLGNIQDEYLFKSSLEGNPDVFVHIQKH